MIDKKPKRVTKGFMSSFIDQIHDRITREGIYFDYMFNANANFCYAFDPRVRI